MDAYCVAFPKKELILGSDLQWKGFMELKPGIGNPELFFAESSVSLRVGQWFSLNGITASVYPRNTIEKAIEKKIGTQPVMKGETITEESLKALTEGKVYPKELTRVPMSRHERIHLMDIISESVAGNGPLQKLGVEEQLDESDMLLIFDTKNIRVLSNTLRWVEAKNIKENSSLIKTLLTICAPIEEAQKIVAWFREQGLHVSPLKMKTAESRLNCSLNGLELNSFDRLIQEGAIPEKLGRKPFDIAEVQEFQKSIPALSAKLESLGVNSPKSALSEESEIEFIEEVDAAEEEIPEKNFDGSIVAPAPVVSTLVKEMVGVAKDFKNLLDVSADLLYKKSEELKRTQQFAMDLYHIVEFCDLSAADGYRIYKTQQQNLRQRRLLKDEIYALDQIVAKLKKGATIDNLDAFIKSVEGMSKRRYHLRGCSMEDIQNLIHSQKMLDTICSENQSIE